MPHDYHTEDEVFAGQREHVDRPMQRLFSTYAKQHWVPLATGIVSSLFAHLLFLVPPYILGVAIDAVFLQNKPFQLPFFPAAWLPAGQEAQFWLTVLIILASSLIGAIFTWSKGWGLNRFAQVTQHQVRTDTYDAMQRLDMAFFQDKQTGELMSILSNDVNRLEQFLNGGFNVLTRMLVTVGGIAVVLFVLNWQLALVTLVTVPVIAYLTHRFVQTIQPIYSDVRSTVGRLNSRLETNLGGIQVIKASTTENQESEAIGDVSQQYFDTNWDAISTRIRFFPTLRLTSGVGFVITFLVGGYWVLTGEAPWLLSGTLSVGEFVTFILLSQRFIWPMAQFGELVNMYQRAYASSERIFGLMNQPSRIQEDEDAEPLELEDGVVEYDDVSFGYDDETIIEDISFEIDGGKTLALVGPTGAGKSTVLKLLLRLYDVDDGAIRIDGQDLRDVTLDSLRGSIGYVGQENYLFYGTIADNIAYGADDPDRGDIIEAAEAVEAHDFIRELEDGYDTEVGERGTKLSGGQRQRIVIARALLQDPDILILDEATSDVDTHTEQKIQEGLETLIQDRTVLAIAHRLSTIKDADTIAVLEDGQIVEQGSHDELLADGGLYEKLWKVQAGEIEDIEEYFAEIED